MRLQYQSFFYIFRTEEFSPWGFLSRKMNEQLFTAAIMPALTGTKLFHGCSTTLNVDKTYHMMLFHEKNLIICKNVAVEEYNASGCVVIGK